MILLLNFLLVFFFQAEDGIRDVAVTGVQTCALPICPSPRRPSDPRARFRFWSRSGQIAWLGGHPRPRDRSRHRRGGIHARPASGEQEKEPARSAYGNELGCWFSRRRRERTRRPARAHRSSVSRTGRERSEEHTSELQSRLHLVCRLLLEKKKQ